MTKSQTKKLINFIQQELAVDEKEITADTQLFKERIINSMNILDLISYLEQERGAEIPDDQVVMKNFQSTQKMVDVFLTDYDDK